MKHIYILLLAIVISSCSSIQIRKKGTSVTQSSTTKSSETVNTSPSKTSKSTYSNTDFSSVVQSAKTYIGTPYRSGGTTKSGMDCSGLVVTSFKENGLVLPRISRDQANAGPTINLSNAVPGDLIFFNTSGRGISHVGIIERIEEGEIFFIHSSSSQGVMISSLESTYWKPRFVKVVRIDPT